MYVKDEAGRYLVANPEMRNVFGRPIAEFQGLGWMLADMSIEVEAARALVRRGMGATSSMIKHGPLTYDQAGRVATIDGKMVELSARELGLRCKKSLMNLPASTSLSRSMPVSMPMPCSR